MKNRRGLLSAMLQCVCYMNLLKDYTNGNLQSQYVGCYYDNSSQASSTVRVMNNSKMTIESCIQTCNESNTSFAIIQDGRNCLCGDILNTSVPSNTCQIPCSGNMNEVCGGSSGTMIFNVVYTVCPAGYYGAGCDQVCHCKQYLPCYRFSGKCPIGCESNWTGDTCNKESNVSNRYIGCYGDSDPGRAMTGYGEHPGVNTIEYCSAICASNNATYVGLQYHSYCFCGERYDIHGTRTNCNTTCSGNSSQFCGGAFANSVYSVCPKGSYGKDCVAQCNCNNADMCPYTTGACNPGCIPGWTGTSCSDRDCSSQNGACSANETCITTNLTFSSVNRCQCSPGYQRTSLWDNCTDIDECNLGMCDQQTTTCNNTIGSFDCNCQNGYKPGNNRTFCKDINECSSDAEICNSTLKYCNNTVGSYTCKCTTGYAIDNNDICKEIPKAPLDNGKAGTIAGAVVGSILGFALIVAIVLLVLYLYRRRQPEKLVNQDLEELPGSSQENSIRNRALSLYAEGPNAYEVIGPTPGNALNTLLNKLSDPDSLKEEFQSVALQPKDFCALGTRDEVKKKNRFINIIPYESNRVTLSRTSDEDTSTYINASYVQGYNNATKFIAAQGPREETLEGFWRMIIENRIHLIVMITNLVENQKHGGSNGLIMNNKRTAKWRKPSGITSKTVCRQKPTLMTCKSCCILYK